MIDRTKNRRLEQGRVGANSFFLVARSGGSQGRQGSKGRLNAIVTKLLIAVLLALFSPIAMRTAPLSPSYGLAAAQFGAGKVQQASQTLERAVSANPENASLQLFLARCYYALKDWDRAAGHAEAAENLEPQNAEIHLWLGRIYGRMAEQQRSFSLALRTRKQFEKAVELDPSYVDARKDLLQFYLDAPWVLGGGQSKAKKEAQAIAALDPAEGALADGKVDEKNGDMTDAAREYQSVVQLRSATPDPYLDAADFFESHHDVTGMKAALAAARKVNPADPRLNYYQGVIDIMDGKELSEAERDLKTYLANGPQGNYAFRASALSWLGDVYERLGKTQLAAQQYHAALQLDPDSSAAHRGLGRVESEEKK